MAQNGLKLYDLVKNGNFLPVKNASYPSKWWVLAKALGMDYKHLEIEDCCVNNFKKVTRPCMFAGIESYVFYFIQLAIEQ